MLLKRFWQLLSASKRCNKIPQPHSQGIDKIIQQDVSQYILPTENCPSRAFINNEQGSRDCPRIKSELDRSYYKYTRTRKDHITED